MGCWMPYRSGSSTTLDGNALIEGSMSDAVWNGVVVWRMMSMVSAAVEDSNSVAVG